MKTFLGLKNVEKAKIEYPSPKNPRTRTLNVESPEIVALAMSIQKNSLLTRPILREMPDGTYETIDGDRRLIAMFDILKESSTEAFVWKMDDKQANIMRLVANWDREDLTSLEKGRYLWEIVSDEMATDKRTPAEDFWSEREIRGEYLKRIADMVGKPRNTVARYITLWRETPEEHRKVIREKKEKLIKEGIRPTKALKITSIGTQLGDVEKTWEILSKPEKRKLNSKDLDIVKKRIRDGQITTTTQMEHFIDEQVDQWDKISVLLKKEERQLAAKLASLHETQIDKIFRASLQVAQAHDEDLANTLAMI